MRLHDIISSSLLPRFADDAEWEQNALDVFVKAVRALSFGLGAPYTRKAISALTDADLQAYFLAYGIISYYPELSRQTRENMLFELARMYRFLGTPYAITALCRYIFDESDAVEVEVKDNLAFDEDGELIDASLLDLFDIAIDAQSASIGGSAGDRIVANILKIARNSQALRNVYFRYEDELSIPVRCADYIGFTYRIGDDYELSRPTGSADETLELLLGMRSSGSGSNDWISVTYSAGYSFWSGIRDEYEHYEAEKFGLQVHTNKWAGNIGGILMDYTYSAEILMVYSDIGGNNAVTPMVDGWVMVSDYVSSVTFVYFGSSNTEGFSTPTMAYYAKFTKHSSAEVEAYSSGSSGVSVNPSGVASIYDVDGHNIWFDSGKKYTLIGVYRPDGGDITSAFKLVARRRTSTPYFSYLAIMNITTTIYPFRRAVIKIEDLNEREAWFKSDKSDYYFNSSYSVLYNTYGEQFVENFERRFEIIRFEDANGNIVTPGSGSLYFTQGTGNVFRLSRSGVPAFTAAKIVYRSLPTTKRAWLNTSHTDKNLFSATAYYLFGDDNIRIKNDGLVTLGSGANIMAVFNSEMVKVDKSGLVFVHYTSDGVDYLLLQNNSPITKTGIACVIYKEA